MSDLPAIWTPQPVRFAPKDLINIKDLYARDATGAEFDRFIRMCEVRGLDPRLGHAYLFIFNANASEKDQKRGKSRQTVTVISEGGYLAAADRIRGHNGDSIYLPDDQEPQLVYAERLINPDSNPLGIESCAVAVRKFAQGEWHRIPARVYWDERAPIIEEAKWDPAANAMVKTGKMALDRKKTGWTKQGRTMMAKCARVAACRYAFPDQMGGLYSEEERDALERGKLEVIDLSPTEAIHYAVKQEQMAAIGAKDAILFDFGEGLQYVPLGLLHDRMEAYFRANPEPEKIGQFCNQNRVGIKEFMMQRKGEWIDLRARFADPAADALRAAAKTKAEGADGEAQTDQS